MKREELKLGGCVSVPSNENYIEGVIVDLDTFTMTVRYLSEDLYITDGKHYYSYAPNLEYVPVSHFCKLENLYEVLMKYCQKEHTDKIQLLGFVLDQKISYYKIGNMYLEIVSFSEFDTRFPLHVYIKEVSDIEDFDIPDTDIPDYESLYFVLEETRYLDILNNKDIDSDFFSLNMCDLDNTYPNPVGVSFFDDGNWLLSLFQLKNEERESGFVYNEEMFTICDDEDEFIAQMQYLIRY